MARLVPFTGSIANTPTQPFFIIQRMGEKLARTWGTLIALYFL